METEPELCAGAPVGVPQLGHKAEGGGRSTVDAPSSTVDQHEKRGAKRALLSTAMAPPKDPEQGQLPACTSSLAGQPSATGFPAESAATKNGQSQPTPQGDGSDEKSRGNSQQPGQSQSRQPPPPSPTQQLRRPPTRPQPSYMTASLLIRMVGHVLNHSNGRVPLANCKSRRVADTSVFLDPGPTVFRQSEAGPSGSYCTKTVSVVDDARAAAAAAPGCRRGRGCGGRHHTPAPGHDRRRRMERGAGQGGIDCVDRRGEQNTFWLTIGRGGASL
eukprot:SAG22_NODE_1435_length_4424_cov_4.592695_3_plen_274_part_00